MSGGRDNSMQHGSDDCDDISESGVDHTARQSNSGQRRRWTAPSKEDGPAVASCQACRRKKAKCSRTQPCSQCERNDSECVYDEIKSKPGMRVGVIENLNQRLTTLENMFLGQGLLWQQVWRHLEAQGNDNSSTDSPSTNLHETTSQLRQSLIQLAEEPPVAASSDSPRSGKRRKVDQGSTEHLRQQEKHNVLPREQQDGHHLLLLPDDLVDSLVDIYFERLHPWTPMLHHGRFKQLISDPDRRPELTTVLHAIVSLCARFSEDIRLGDSASRAKISKRSREIVILRSMESFSVTNLQALIICAFDTIASGRGPSAWSIVGSMTRTAEQLQLSVEDTDKPMTACNGVIRRIAFVPRAKDWIEEEERRRVFWNIFQMDRFCSISTGWNLSITSADARRRLPCEGGLWQLGEPLDIPTPYFGVSDHQSNSSKDSFPLSSGRPETEDQNSLGGFAYCIEATESLSLVTSFFLHHTIDVTRAQDAQMWLMRFKQLDLRLVQWKVYLPPRWREACAVNADGNMDPNLTLAHITHNTSVVLLHQGIAYPSPEWQATPIKLPSQSSAETCLAAATEVATMAQHFLGNSKFLANHQFAFCLFVCGRMLLAHSSYLCTPLSSSFDSLVESLKEISKRWNGLVLPPSARNRSGDLASKFASRLEEAKNSGPTTLDIRQAAYSEDDDRAGLDRTLSETTYCPSINPPPPGGFQTSSTLWTCGDASNLSSHTDASPESISLAFPPLPQAFQGPGGSQTRVNSSEMAMGGVYNYTAHHPGDVGGQIYQGFEDISAFLDGTFLPDQRISMYAQPADNEV